MDLLKREHAPITPAAWTRIDDEAKRVLEINLAGRKLVDFDGPHGWQYAAVNTGQLTIRPEGALGVPWGVRDVVPLIEVRVPFELPIMALDNASRGAILDLTPVVKAAEKTAHAEDDAIFNGLKAGGIEGILPSASHPAIAIPDNYADYPSIVVDAAETLRRAGVNGPYALALGPVCYAGLAQAAQDGYPIRERVEHFLDGPIVLAPKVDGAVLLSHRGGDFQLSVGQDLSIGYAGHDRDRVYLYLTESFAFRVLERSAAVYLKPKGNKSSTRTRAPIHRA
jgi:uncharacterized linocin/CFP29 family protein